MVGVVAAAAELVPALGAAEVHAAAFRQSVLEPAVRTGCGTTNRSGKSSYSKHTQRPARLLIFKRAVDGFYGLNY